MAKILAISCILVSVLLGGTESSDKFRVAGGVAAKAGQFPFLVSIQYDEHHFCGGTIIAKDVILTAAHCLKDKSAHFISVVAGTHNLQSGEGVRIAAKRITPHPTFSFEGGDSDIGLVILSSPLTYSANIQPAELSTEDYSDRRDYVTIAGWGITTKYSMPTVIARYANMPLVESRICSLYVPRLTKNMICAGTPDGQTNACPGDSGGPIFIGKKVVGIVSFGFGCQTPGMPAVYTSLPGLLSWISANSK